MSSYVKNVLSTMSIRLDQFSNESENRFRTYINFAIKLYKYGPGGI